MPTRLAIQASRVHNAWLCLIWIVLFFRPQAKKNMRSGNATTMAASRHPDHHPEVTSTNPNLCGLPMVYQTSYELRVRLTVYLFRSIGDSRRSASPSAPQSGAKRPAEKCK